MTRRSILIAHPSPDLYGSDRVLLETVSALEPSARPIVVVLPADGPLAGELRARGADVRVASTPVLRKSYLSVAGLFRLVLDAMRSLPAMIRLTRATHPALLVANTVTVPLWVIVGRALRVPVVCHVHEAELSASSLVRKVLYAPLLLCQGIVVNSRFSLDVLLGAWPQLAHRSQVVYNGVPGPEHASEPRQHLTPPVGLLYVGRLSPRKGPQVAIEAVRQLVAAGRDVRLDVLGSVFPGYEWFEAELLETVKREGLESQVTFLGFDPNVWSRFESNDIVLVPSTVDEPFGNTAVEAMMAMRPLVVSATSGLLEAAADYRAVQFVSPDDAVALAGAIDKLVDGWPTIIGLVAEDRDLALERHGLANYKRNLRSAIAGMLVGSARSGEIL